MGTSGIYGIVNDGKFYGLYQHWDMYPEGHPTKLMRQLADMGAEGREQLARSIPEQSWTTRYENIWDTPTAAEEADGQLKAAERAWVDHLNSSTTDNGTDREDWTVDKFYRQAMEYTAIREAALHPSRSYLMPRSFQVPQYDDQGGSQSPQVTLCTEPDWDRWAQQTVALKPCAPSGDMDFRFDDQSEAVMVADFDAGVVRYRFHLRTIIADMDDDEEMYAAGDMLAADRTRGSKIRVGKGETLDHLKLKMMKDSRFAPWVETFFDHADDMPYLWTPDWAESLEDGMWKRPAGMAPFASDPSGGAGYGFETTQQPASSVSADSRSTLCGAITRAGLPCQRRVPQGGQCPAHPS